MINSFLAHLSLFVSLKKVTLYIEFVPTEKEIIREMIEKLKESGLQFFFEYKFLNDSFGTPGTLRDIPVESL